MRIPEGFLGIGRMLNVSVTGVIKGKHQNGSLEKV
jgi:hypothetical protein